MTTTGLEIAVIGMACRFPGASTPEEFWRNLREGVDSVSFFSPEELRTAGVAEELLRHPDYVPAAAVLDDPARFDAPFFGFSPREAEILDPQHRHFLECAWEAFERAGYDPARYDGRVGVYAGTSMNSYLFDFHRETGTMDPVERYQTLILSDKDYLPTRLAYKLNLTGPSVAIQTACSTSLVAVHMACRALLGGECEMALAGGVSIKVPHRVGYLFREGGIASPDGRCRAFDADAAGAVGGNGVGIVLLKRLEDALAEGDHVHAVIKGSAINNDGGLKVGYTAPSVEGQAEAIRGALLMAEVEPESVSYVEAHGTGTALGDPIEVAALQTAFGDDAPPRSCGLGSVKTNIGHLDAAAGVAGMIKTILALEHGEIPPSLHFRSPNPETGLDAGRFYVVDRRTPWAPPAGAPRRAGVSSFGIGGTNAHVVVEEAPVPEAVPESSGWQLLRLSARTSEALEEATDRLAGHLEITPGVNLRDVAFTLQVGRRPFPYRRLVVGSRPDALAAALRERRPGAVLTAESSGDPRPVAFLFPGLGTQYVGMGLALYRRPGRFREVLDQCAEVLRPELGLDLREALYPDGAGIAEEPGDGVLHGGGPALRSMVRPTLGGDELTARLRRTAVLQPCLFALEYALAEQWRDWGVRPAALLGYSLGEYVAACVAGVMTLDDALLLVARRARLLEDLPKGGMLAVPLAEEETRELLKPEVSISAINGPHTTVVGGPLPAIDELEERLSAEGTPTQRLETSHAFHSAMMAEREGELAALFREVELSPPRIPYLSNVSGTWITPEQATDPAYWAGHTREPVRFAAAVGELWQEPRRLLIECGPSHTLCSLANQHPDRSGGTDHLCLPTLPGAFESQDAVGFLLQTLGKLWLAGHDVDWTRFHGGGCRRVPLPTYPFARRRYWARRARAGPERGVGSSGAEHLSSGAPRVTVLAETWKRALSHFQCPPALPEASRAVTLILAPESQEEDRRLGRLLEERGERVVRPEGLEPADGPPVPPAPESYERLLQKLAAGGEWPDRVVHLGGAAERADGLEDELARGAWSLRALLEGLRRAGAGSGGPPWPSILVVTRGAQRVLSTDTVVPARAALAALCRETPDGLLKSLDIGPRSAGSGPDLPGVVLAELLEPGPEREIGERFGTRWVRVVEPVPHESWRSSGRGGEEGAVYAFVGALDGLAADLALALARRGAKLAWIANGSPEETGRSTDVPASQAAGEPTEGRVDFDLGSSGRELAKLEAEVLADLRAAGLRSYDDVQELADELCTAHLARYLAASGVEAVPGREVSRSELDHRLGVDPRYRRFVDYALEVLAQDRVVDLEGTAVRFLEAAGRLRDPRDVRREIEDREPRLAPLLDLLDRAVESYRETVTGRRPALDVLYPGGSSEVVEGLYEALDSYRNDRVYIEAVRRLVTGMTDRPDAGRPLRILEVGMGNGFLTWPLAADLAGRNVVYHATDLGKLFVDQARRKASDRGFDFLRFDVLDASRDPVAQGFPVGSFDLVLGLNVVHATPRIETTLAHLRTLLAPRGMLCLIEGVRSQRWNNMIWGLTEAWWHFQDAELRGHGPLLPIDRWEAVMARQGFAATLALPGDAETRRSLDHALLLMQQGHRVAAPAGATARDPVRELRALGVTPLVLRTGAGESGQLAEALDRTERELGSLRAIVHAAEGTDGGEADGVEPLLARLQLQEQVHDLARLRARPWIGLGPGGPRGPLRAMERGFLAGLADAGTAPAGFTLEGPASGADGLDLAGLVEGARTRGVTRLTVTGGSAAAAGEEHSPESPGAGAVDHDRPILGTPYEEPRTDVERRIVTLWQEALGIRKVGVHDDFFELGGDSLIGLRVMTRLGQELPHKLPVQTLFDHPTTAQLAGAIEEALVEQLETLSDEEAELLLAEMPLHDGPRTDA